MTKQDWMSKLQKQGIDAYWDHNVLMYKTDNKENAKRYLKAVKGYPYSYGIKKIGGNNDEGEVLQDTEEA